MKHSLVLGVVASLASLAIVGPTQAGAAASPAAAGPHAAVRAAAATRTTGGRTVSYKAGKLRIAVGKKAFDFVVTRATKCEDARAKRGTSIRCGNLGQARYRGKPVRVTWYVDARKRRVARLVTVDTGPRAGVARVAMRTVNGSMVSVKRGKMRVIVRKKANEFVINRLSECAAVRDGQGVKVPCASLDRKQYRGKPVRLGWYLDGRKRRVAAVVSVMLS